MTIPETTTSSPSERTLTVLIVRHGQTNHNIQRILQGHLNTRLNESGRAQAVTLGKYLKSNTNTKIDAVFSSDLQRCITTTNLIISQMGYIQDDQTNPSAPLQNPDSNDHHYTIPVTFTSNLRERHLGELQEMFIKDAHAKADKEGKTFMDYGETLKHVNGRLRHVWAELIDSARKNPDWSTVLIVSHGGAIAKLCSDLVNTGSVKIAESVPLKSISVVPNTSVTTLKVPLHLDGNHTDNLKEGKIHKQGSLEVFGSTTHLEVPVVTYQDEQ